LVVNSILLITEKAQEEGSGGHQVSNCPQFLKVILNFNLILISQRLSTNAIIRVISSL
jgi:hypothetical protein